MNGSIATHVDAKPSHYVLRGSDAYNDITNKMIRRLYA